MNKLEVIVMEKEELLYIFHKFCRKGLEIKLCKPVNLYTEYDDKILNGLQIIQHEIDKRIKSGEWC